MSAIENTFEHQCRFGAWLYMHTLHPTLQDEGAIVYAHRMTYFLNSLLDIDAALKRCHSQPFGELYDAVT